ncbi:MAG: hypothetical protein JNL54_05740 [Kineosporiaceae bacterium]|nr:hypothetical protein [Kineosporiaceae bacterium]
MSPGRHWLLLGRDRHDPPEQESVSSGLGVALEIGPAVDTAVGRDVAVRATAARRLLAMTADPVGSEPDWTEIKALLEDQVSRSRSEGATGPR